MKNYSGMTNEELRVEVAEALGWKSIGVFAPCEGEPDEDDVFGVPPVGRIVKFRGKTLRCCAPVPKFPTDISAAWELVEMITTWGFSLRRDNGIYGAMFFIPSRAFESCHKEAPRAICIAFLLAMDGGAK